MKTKIISILYLFIVSFSFSQSKNLDYLEQEKNKTIKIIEVLSDSLIVLNRYKEKLEEKINDYYQDELDNAVISDSTIVITLKKGAKLLREPEPISDPIMTIENDIIVSVVDYSKYYFEVCVGSICGFVSEVWVKGDATLDSYVRIKNEEINQEFIKRKNDVQLEIEREERIIQKKENEEKKKILSIVDIRVPPPNSADGVSFVIDWRYSNYSKIIKYIYFTVVPYNDVGDIVYSSISGQSTFIGEVTGPVKARDWINHSMWENAWYNNTITCVRLIKVRIQYIDGSSYTYANELPKILHYNFSNKCKYKG